MNKFRAMSKVLHLAEKTISDVWVFKFKGIFFAEISKSNNKYFVHYHNRSTALTGYDTYMKAAAMVADLYCRLYNSDAVAGGKTILTYKDITLYMGSDSKPYTSIKGRFSVQQIIGNTYSHLKHYYGDSMSDSEIGHVADLFEIAIVDCYKEMEENTY